MDNKSSPPPRERAPEPEVDAGEKKMKLGADFGLPVGDWSDAAGNGLGALLLFEVEVAPNIAITARAGYIGHLETETSGISSSTSEMPLLFPGIKAKSGGPYGAAEMGLVNVSATIALDDFFGGEVSESEMKFGFTLVHRRRDRLKIRGTSSTIAWLPLLPLLPSSASSRRLASRRFARGCLMPSLGRCTGVGIATFDGVLAGPGQHARYLRLSRRSSVSIFETTA